MESLDSPRPLSSVELTRRALRKGRHFARLAESDVALRPDGKASTRRYPRTCSVTWMISRPACHDETAEDAGLRVA